MVHNGAGPAGAGGGVARRELWSVVRRLLVPVYLPWTAATLGAGVLLPVLPVYLEESGLSLSLIGVITAAAGLGSALGGIPGSAISERRGTDALLVVALTMCAVSTALLGLTTAVIVLVVLRVAYGLGFAGITQSRQVVVARGVEPGLLGRVNSLVGGMHRLAFVIGPVVGGGVYNTWGANPTFILAGALTSVGLLTLSLPGGRDRHPVATEANRVRIGASLWQHRRRLFVAALGPLLVASARSGRHVVVPLIGDDLDLNAASIGLVVAVGTAADFMLFPVSGWLMDRHGRLASMVPAFSLMAFGMLLLSLADSVTAVVVAGIVMGLGNGLSAGTMLTLSTDLAPADEPGPFIAGFHTVSGAGTIIGPLMVGWIADAVGLGAAAFALAVSLAAGTAWIAFVIGETGKERAEKQ
ncbi:MAG: MFS family permease [Candidatus Aldehydirespiratoraceae bacterium]|jgi:MFS family permease